MQMTLEYNRESGRLSAYQYFVFLNSSVRGPFIPSYMPKHWRWPDAFIDRLTDSVLKSRLWAVLWYAYPLRMRGGLGPKVIACAFKDGAYRR